MVYYHNISHHITELRPITIAMEFMPHSHCTLNVGTYNAMTHLHCATSIECMNLRSVGTWKNERKVNVRIACESTINGSQRM